LINLKTLELGGKLSPFPPGYSPGGNRILIANYRPARLEFVIERSLCAHPFGNSN